MSSGAHTGSHSKCLHNNLGHVVANKPESSQFKYCGIQLRYFKKKHTSKAPIKCVKDITFQNQRLFFISSSFTYSVSTLIFSAESRLFFLTFMPVHVQVN